MKMTTPEGREINAGRSTYSRRVQRSVDVICYHNLANYHYDFIVQNISLLTSWNIFLLHSGGREIPRHLWNPKSISSVHKIPLHNRIVSHESAYLFTDLT
jgi:hypothetical protein